MNHKIFLIISLIITILLGSVLSYITVINQEPPIPEEILTEIKNDFKSKVYYQAEQMWRDFERYEAEISAIKDFTHTIWQNESLFDPLEFYYHNSVPGMAQPADLAYNEIYDDEIALSASAYKIAPTAFVEEYQDEYLSAEVETVDPLTKVDQDIYDLINKSAKLDYIFKDLYQTFSDTLWLYMGFEKGIHRTYPYHDLGRDYDPRLRPWYISAVTGAKDIVLVIDKSGSMEGAVFEEVKQAALQVVDNLGSRDRFNVITFSDEVELFVNSLEVKSSQIEEDLGLFLNKTRTGGTTNINEALIKSTELLGTYGANDHTPIVLFLTDGKPTTGVTNNDTIIENIRKSNYANAHIITFGIGKEVDYELMGQIAADNEGTVIRINETLDIGFALQSYASFISKVSQNEVISWGFPLIDAAGQGLIITASSTIYENEELLGVLSVDLHLKDLIDDIINFRGNGEYTFLFNVGGISLIHDSFIDIDINKWEELNVRKPIEEYETDDPKFIALKEIAKAGGYASDIISYETGPRVVALAPIGRTGIIYGIAGSLDNVINPSVIYKLSTLFINPISIIPGIGGGLFVAVIIFVYISRKGSPKLVKFTENVVLEDISKKDANKSEVDQI